MSGVWRFLRATLNAGATARILSGFAIVVSICGFAGTGSSAADALTRAPSVEPWAWEKTVNDTERRAINALCAGHPADFGVDTETRPHADGSKNDKRRLSAGFMEMAVLLEPCTTKPFPHHGVHIYSAWIPEDIDLTGAEVDRDLWFQTSLFDGNVIFDRSKVNAFVKLESSSFAKIVRFSDAEVSGDLILNANSFHDNVDLSGINIGRDLSLDQSRLQKDLVLKSGYVRGELSLNGLTMDTSNEEHRLDLQRATVDKQLSLNNALLSGNVNVNMDGVQIGSSLNAYWLNHHADGSQLASPWTGTWQLYNARIGGDFKLVNADLRELKMLNMTGTQIQGTLFLGSWDFTDPTGKLLVNVWGDQSRLVLNNVKVQSIVDAVSNGKDSWPVSRGSVHASLELDGFTYAKWDGLDRQFRATDGVTDALPPRDSGWLIRWLQRDKTFTPQPYEQLSGVVATQGMHAAANEIMFSRFDYERHRAWGDAGPHSHTDRTRTFRSAHAADPNQTSEDTDSPETGSDWEKALILQMKWLINGYGYRPYYTVLWFALLIAIGTILFKLTYQKQSDHRVRVRYALEYTLDALLPAVSISKEFENIIIQDRWVRYYFIILKPLSFLFIAALLKTASSFATGTIE